MISISPCSQEKDNIKVQSIYLSCLLIVSLQGENQRRLYRELLKNYNRLERPVVNDSQSLVVDLQLSLLQIIDVDEKNQVLITNAWLQMSWMDVYLKWDQNEYPGVQNLRFPADQIWVPDILLYNSADERFDATFHTNVLVNYSGSCQYIPPGILKSTCYIDVRWFPFDVQKCNLKFGSWTHNGWLLDLQMLEADISNYISNGEWDLVGVPGERNERYYECCKEPYPDVTYTVTMRRRTLYYGLNLLIPCVLISGLALLVFLLPADSGEKISLGITVLLSLTVFMLLVAEIMPATSDSVPLIAQYFASIMVIVGLSVVVTVLVLQFHHHDPQAGKMPRWVRVILLNWCAWFLRMKKPGESIKPLSCKYGHSRHQSSVSSVEMNVLPGHQSSNGNVIYSYHAMENPCCPQNSDAGSKGENGPGPSPEDTELLQQKALMDTIPVIVKILEEVQFIAARFRKQDEGEEICSEWKFAAAVIDRLCLVAFSLFAIICTLTILMSAPNFIEAVSKDFT
ncbi:neuronal acetylcholine receptor subunit alpha-7-like [Eublepharis macularius]|uniref:Neuronal acetylcholine receptor subunit alpha-7 n=1 Tax=Eublepharis macularius TaxID=481883 RepID=A0AA97JQT6_EUBMA|nr:neuronal acetylcholine receptor subunit alpha-7-like [Eublepharis macularius]